MISEQTLNELNVISDELELEVERIRKKKKNNHHDVIDIKMIGCYHEAIVLALEYLTFRHHNEK